MIAFKACSRCRGDLLLGNGETNCLACGFRTNHVKSSDIRDRGTWSLPDAQARTPAADQAWRSDSLRAS